MNKIKHNLCKNILLQKCIYGNKCNFAHSIQEQKLSNIRNIIYNSNDLSNIDLYKQKYIYDEILLLTKVCDNCINNICTGGLNCISGAYSHKYVICKNDVIYGKCDELNCTKIHLSQKGLTPYYKQSSLIDDVIKNDDSLEDIDSITSDNENKNENKNKYNFDKSIFQ